MGLAGSRSRRAVASRARRRACAMLVAAQYRKTWDVASIQKGWGRFEVIYGGWDKVSQAARLATRLPQPSVLILAAAHGGATGEIQLAPDEPSHTLAEVLAEVLPLFEGARIHFHCCQLGHAFDDVCGRLTRMAALKRKLGEAPRSWRLSGFLQDIPYKPIKQRPSETSFAATWFDTFLADVSALLRLTLRGTLPPRYVQLILLGVGTYADICTP